MLGWFLSILEDNQFEEKGDWVNSLSLDSTDSIPTY